MSDVQDTPRAKELRKAARSTAADKPDRHASNRFKGVSAAVLIERDEQGNFLIQELQRLGVQVRHLWPAPSIFPSDAEILYCDYAPDLCRSLPWIPGEAKSALVVILPQQRPIDPDLLVKATPNATLARPISRNEIVATLAIARSQVRYEQRLRSKLERLEDNLRSMRTVERAKTILMSTRHIDGDQAYNFIRHQAMDRRVPVSSIAAAIVSSHELLGADFK